MEYDDPITAVEPTGPQLGGTGTVNHRDFPMRIDSDPCTSEKGTWTTLGGGLATNFYL